MRNYTKCCSVDVNSEFHDRLSQVETRASVLVTLHYFYRVFVNYSVKGVVCIQVNLIMESVLFFLNDQPYLILKVYLIQVGIRHVKVFLEDGFVKETRDVLNGFRIMNFSLLSTLYLLDFIDGVRVVVALRYVNETLAYWASQVSC